ncbi:tryptophan synthase subunit alpha [Basilea psittacipulmonis]|uniref:Tryptophan synthase alpha chain n=1 Tax=Basilea psittacipulmonis DSM 24701 TaxID=1072685 RepID=A0A077DFN1_9BURK|nr:tryptophan synthase subunit alpha [Basilea psittacipulmonis]AIL32162.1 tryptophan synthase alpha chain [Basilea psittacipulmonis DSM 24701]
MSDGVSPRIDQAFAECRAQKKAALIPYICAGDPDPSMTVSLMHALVKGGADVIELGVPFSDPAADGPTIQLASERAIKKGTSLIKTLEMVKAFRQSNTRTPVVLMGYGNPIEAMGHVQFAQKAQESGVDGVLIVDFPPEEYDEFEKELKNRQISPIFLLAPTSNEARMKEIAKIASGYIYYVSLKGVTGSGTLDTNEVKQRVELIKQHVGHIPVGVGFGIKDAESAKAIASVADAVVIGSKLIQVIESAMNSPESSVSKVCDAASSFLSEINAALIGK